MTPDHHHAYLAIAAMQKGKHVITHKPIANRMSEGRLAIETAKIEYFLLIFQQE